MEKDTYLTTVKPQNNRLKKLIAYYYFHVSDNNQHTESFYFYPNYLHALTIYKGNEVKSMSIKKHRKFLFLKTKTSLLFYIPSI